MKRIAAFILCLLVLGVSGSALCGQLITDTRGVTIQGLAPDPVKSQNHAINNSDTYTLTVSGWTVMRFYSDQELKVKLNSNTAYFRSRGGMYVISPDVTQIKFTNNSGSTANLDIEGM